MADRGLPKCGFAVDGTKKGALPIKVESRAKGKKVTLIENVRGDGQLLCSTLASLLGTGGTVVHHAGQQVVQLQGSQQERVSNSLRDLECLRGVKEDEKPKKATKQNEVATRHCAYDKFLRQESKPSLAKILEGEAYAAKCLPGAECFRWHGYWVYCRGCCEQTDDSDVWEESGRFCDPSLDKAGHWEAVDLGAPLRPRSVAQLDDYLRKLGMLAEVGEAALTWGLRDLRSGTPLAPLGTTLAQYRRMAVGPGAKLIETSAWDVKGRAAKGKEKVKASALQPAGLNRSKSQPAPKVPQDEGCFKCPTCQNHFALYKTLKIHMKLSHNEAVPPKHLVAYTPPKLPPRNPTNAVARVCSVPPRKREKPVVRWGPNAAVSPSMSKVEVKESAKCDESVANLERHLPSCCPEPLAPPEVPREATGSPVVAEDDDNGLVEMCEDCPICKQSVSFEKLQAHVERCLRNPPATELWKECPICQEKFHPDALDAHVQSCLDEAEDLEDDDDDDNESEVSDASDGITDHPLDLNGYPVLRVLKGFEPQGDGEAKQIRVVKDQLFLRLWQQPLEEGGYWAWGCLVTWEREDYYGSKLGYVPLSHLSVHDESTAHEAPPNRDGLMVSGDQEDPPCSSEGEHPVLRVLRAFRANEGDDEESGQICVEKDDLFVREWQQPIEEGGQWAWGCVVIPGRREPVKWGYVPLSHLAAEDAPTVEEPAPQEAAAPARRWARRFEG